MALRSYKNLFSSQWNHNVNKSEIKYNTQCVLFQPQAGFQCTEMPRSFTKWHALIVLLVHCRVYLFRVSVKVGQLTSMCSKLPRMPLHDAALHSPFCEEDQWDIRVKVRKRPDIILARTMLLLHS